MRESKDVNTPLNLQFPEHPVDDNGLLLVLLAKKKTFRLGVRVVRFACRGSFRLLTNRNGLNYDVRSASGHRQIAAGK